MEEDAIDTTKHIISTIQEHKAPEDPGFGSPIERSMLHGQVKADIHQIAQIQFRWILFGPGRLTITFTGVGSEIA